MANFYESLLNLPSLNRFADHESASKRFSDAVHRGFGDAAAGVVLARNLEVINPRIFEKKYPELAFMNSGIGIDNTGGYAQRIQTLRLLEQGGFSQAGDRSGNKGKISLTAEDSTLPIIAEESHSTWTDDEVKQAERDNINLPQRFLTAHNKAYQQEVDRIGLVGSGAINFGLLDNALFTSTSAAGAISTLNAQEMYDEIASLITDQHSAVNNTPEYMATRVMMPTRVANKLRATILNTANGSMSVMRALEQNFPDVMFLATFRADTEANGGSLSTSAVVAYNPNEEAMVMRIPIPLTISEIIKIRPFEFEVDSKFRIGGLDILETTAGRILTGL